MVAVFDDEENRITVGRIVYGVMAMMALLWSAGSPALANPLPRYGEFLYSSLCWKGESGDAAGFRVRLVRSPQRDSLYLDWSEGGLYGPMLATELAIDPNSKLAFTIPANTPPSDIPTPESYAGEISSEAITLKNVDAVNDRPYVIPRVTAFDTDLPPCRER